MKHFYLNDRPFFKMSLGNGAMVCLKHKKILIVQPFNWLQMQLT